MYKVKRFLVDRFTLSEDKADEEVIIESIRKDVSFRGTNLWTLIFAILIASIGLNVNSTAVIIGAMLISPLMGPIMGMGLSIGINDFDLLKKGTKNLLIAAGISVFTSFVYFKLTPLHVANSELLARTTPSLWDVFIAFLGGLAGIVAGTRKEKSNVIPGVAIATALMPPLCTAGFGLATGQWFYFLGAAYLFFINCLFICMATFLIVKHLRFRRVQFASPEQQKRVSRYMLLAVVLTILPSIYLAYRIVQRSIFETNADKFVEAEFRFAKTQVVTRTYKYDSKQSAIDLLLVGQPVAEGYLDSAMAKMKDYGLDDVRLTIYQGLDAKQKIDLSAIKASVLEELSAGELVKDSVRAIVNKLERPIPDVQNELKILYPALREFTLSHNVVYTIDSARTDTITLFVAKFAATVSKDEKNKLSNWLQQRLPTDSVRVVIE